MVKMEVAGSATCVTPEAVRMEKVGRAVDTTVTVALDLGGGRRSEIVDGLVGDDRSVCVELQRCGWRWQVKAAEAVGIHGVDGIVIGLDDADEVASGMDE